MDGIFSTIFGFLLHWASVFWATMRETSPFLVFGLLLAGMLHVLVPPRIILWALGHGGWRGAIRGAVVGVPLPLCSCGVTPTALTLRRQGASLSAAVAFMIATPETSADALAITAAMLPTIYLGARPLAALLLAIGVGTVVEVFSINTREQLRLNVLRLSRAMDSQAGSALESASAKKTEVDEICRVCGLMLEGTEDHSHPWISRIGAIFSYAFGTFFRDIASWVVLGLAFAALVQMVVPADALHSGILGKYPSFEVFLAILMSIPMYSCATATTPLAAVLLTKGLNPGAALVLLLAGPATNIGNIFALRRELGLRITALYYAALFLFCWIIGVAFNFTWPFLMAKFPELGSVAAGKPLEWMAHGMPDWLEIAAAWLLVVLTANIWVRALLHAGHHHHDDAHAH